MKTKINPASNGGRGKSRGSFIVLGLFFGLALVLAAGLRAQPTDLFPQTGLRSIFRDDFKFVSLKISPDPLSLPPTRFHNNVRLFDRLEDSFEWRFKLLEAAQQKIWIETYIFTGDEIGWKAARILAAKQKQGLDVRLLIDCYTKFNPRDQKLFLWMTHQGIDIRGFEPLYLVANGDNRFPNIDDLNQRFHEKYWNIDDQAGFMGGTNIANEYARYGDEPKKKWRDQDILVTGPILEDITRAFGQNYDYFTHRQEDRFKINQTSWYGDLYRQARGLAEPVVDIFRQPGQLPLPEFTAANVPVRFIRQRPRDHEDYCWQAFIHLIETSKKSILIETAYFVPDDGLMQALIHAKKRGLDVKLVTNCEETNDVAGIVPLTRWFYQPLMEAGIRIWEWQGDHPGFGSMHAKCGVFDGQVVEMGSPNLDHRSLEINAESMLLIDSVEASEFLTRHITTVDMKYSLEITLAQAQYWHKPTKPYDALKLIFGLAIEDWY
jgi:cardiolipin synthase